jgi:hypothetical protein
MHEDWELFARAALRGCAIQAVPEALSWFRLGPGPVTRRAPQARDYARSLRPFLEDVPAIYHDLWRLAQGQALETDHLRTRLRSRGGDTKPLRYRAADALHLLLTRGPLAWFRSARP